MKKINLVKEKKRIRIKINIKNKNIVVIKW